MNDKNNTPVRARLIGSQFCEVDDSECKLSTTGPGCIRLAAVLLSRQGISPDRELIITTSIRDAMKVNHD
jgi:hypothetical protein